MAIQTGINKKVAFGKETTWNVACTGGVNGTYLRRVTSDLELNKQTFQSNELRTDYQIADVRHGLRSVGGSIKGELSPGAYSMFLGSGLRKDFTALAAVTAAAATVAGTWSAAAPSQTITLPAGQLAKGWKAGMVMRITSATNLPNNVNRNFFLTGVTDTTLTGVAWPLSSGLDTSGSGTMTSLTMSATGKYTYAPETAQTNDAYDIEHYFGDLTLSENFTGCRVMGFDINMPATGMALCDVSFMGGNVVTAGAQKFSAAGNATAFGVLAGVNGVVSVAGSLVGILQSITMKYEGGTSTGAVVGATTSPDVFQGRVKVTGSLVVYFQDATLRDAFLNETKIAILGAAFCDNTNASDFVSFAMYNVKLTDANKSDGEQGLTVSCTYQALINLAPANNTTDQTLRTTLMLQDSQAL